MYWYAFGQRILICVDCFIFDHRDHKIDNVDAIIEEKKNNLLRDWKAIEEPLQIKMLKEQQHLQEMVKKDTIKLQSLKEQGDKYFQQSFEMLKLAEQKFHQELKELKEQRENEISPKLQVLERSLAEIKMQSQTLQASLSHGNAAQWLSMESSVRKEFEKWAWNQEPEVEYQFEAKLPSIANSVNQIGIRKQEAIQAKSLPAPTGRAKTEVKLKIIGAKNLPAALNASVIINTKSGSSPKDIMRTNTQINRGNPVWNEAFTIPLGDRNDTLIINCLGHNMIAEHSLGSCELGLDMLSHNKPTPMTLKLSKQGEIDVVITLRQEPF